MGIQSKNSFFKKLMSKFMFKKSQSLGGGKNMGKTIEVFDVLVKTTHRL